MKRSEFNDVLFEEATEALLNRLSEDFADCKATRTGEQSAGQKAGLKRARQNGGGFDQMPKATQRRVARAGGAAPRRQRCDAQDTVDNNEVKEPADILDFMRCQRADGSFYGTSGVCRKGAQVGAKEQAPKKKNDFSETEGPW